jgi:hypothetical protein
VKTRFAICLAVVAAAAVSATPVFAQNLLPPHEITTSVRSMGLQPISRPVLRGARYVLRAIDGRGAEVRVAADAIDGRIIAVRPMGYRQGPAYAERFYPPGNYPMEAAPPRGGYERLAPPPGAYERPARIPSDPSVIYAPGSNATGPQPLARPPSAAKPPAPKVVAKPAPKTAAKPAAPPAETSAAAEKSDGSATTGATSSLPAAENSAIAVPPVQSLE